MAAKRMFSIKLIKSDAFLSMPLSSQALYFHMNLEADDDGFIGNPKGIQRMVGASEDDLKLLILKGFLISFDSGVLVVKHWRMHNTLQGDRYSATAYQEEGKTLLIKKNGAYTFDENQAVCRLENKWKQNVSKLFPQSSTVQCSVVESSKELLLPNKENKDTSGLPKVNQKAATTKKQTIYVPPSGIYVEIQSMYNQICTSLRPVERLTTKRKGYINTLLEKGYKINDFQTLFEKTMTSEYFKNLQEGQWKPSFDWLMQEDNMLAVMEGKYDKVFNFKGKEVKKNNFNNFTGRNYTSEDMKNLERELLRK